MSGDLVPKAPMNSYSGVMFPRSVYVSDCGGAATLEYTLRTNP